MRQMRIITSYYVTSAPGAADRSRRSALMASTQITFHFLKTNQLFPMFREANSGFRGDFRGLFDACWLLYSKQEARAVRPEGSAG